MALSKPPQSIFNNTVFSRNHSISEDYAPQVLQLAKLLPIFGKFILSYTKNGFYIFDPRNSDVILWCDEIPDIQTCKIVNGNCLIIFTSQSELYSLSCRSVEDAFVDMLQQLKFSDCHELIQLNRTYFETFARTQEFLAQMLKTKNILVEQRYSTEINDIFNELSLLDEMENFNSAATAIRKHENGIYVVENSYAAKSYSNSTNNATDENIKSVFKSASRNIFNKLNIFTESNQAVNSSIVSSPIVNMMIDSRPIIPYTSNYMPNQYSDSDEIVAVTTTNKRRRQLTLQRRTSSPSSSASSLPPTSNDIVKKKDFRLNSNQITDEERLLQNLFMIYKSSKISNLTLVDRYSYIFDKYDCNGIRDLLRKLGEIIEKNGASERTAERHCYEMYLNYLNPDMIWEFDKESLEYVINGFILLNAHEESKLCDRNGKASTTTRCNNCQFPLLIKHHLAVCKYKDLGYSIFKYLWSRNMQDRCYDMANLAPWSIEIICKFLIHSCNDNVMADKQKFLQLLFSSGNRDLFYAASNADWFTSELWESSLNILIRLYEHGEVICSRCEQCSMIAEFAGFQAEVEKEHDAANQSSNSDTITWSWFLSALYDRLSGRKSLGLLKKYSSQITCDAIKKEFYLKCLLRP